MTKQNIVLFRGSDIPATREGLLTILPQRPKDDVAQIKAIILELYEDEVVNKALKAHDRSTAVEGSLLVNDILLCERIRDYARTNNMPPVAAMTITEVRAKLVFALRQLKLARSQRGGSSMAAE